MPDAPDTTNMRDRILSSIAEQGIAPKPRWHFLVHEWVVWLVAVLTFAVGSIASALSIYIANVSRFMEGTIELSRLDTVFEAVPLVWIVLFGVAMLYSVHALRETRRGYRFHSAWLVLLAVVASVGMGSVLYAHGMSAAIDRYLLAELPIYQPLSGYRSTHWMQPHQGVIAGVVLEARGSSFTVRSLDGSDLQVVRSTSTVSTCLRGETEIAEGIRVRITGTSTGEGTYEAYEVCQFEGRGGVFHGRGGRMRAVIMNVQ